MKDILKDFNAKHKTTHQLDCLIKSKRLLHPVILKKCVTEMQFRKRRRDIKAFAQKK